MTPEHCAKEVFGGSCEIRTHGGDKPSPVFKTGALNRSAKLPELHILAGLEHAFGFDERNHFFQAGQVFEVGHRKGLHALGGVAHALGI